MVFTVQRGQNARQGRGGRRPREPGGGDTWRGGGVQDPGRVMGCSARCTHWHPQYLYFYILACPVSRLDLLLGHWLVKQVREIKISLRKNTYNHFISWTPVEAKSIKSSDSRKGRLTESFAAKSSSFILFIEIYH